jgi:hypothetical protein
LSRRGGARIRPVEGPAWARGGLAPRAGVYIPAGWEGLVLARQGADSLPSMLDRVGVQWARPGYDGHGGGARALDTDSEGLARAVERLHEARAGGRAGERAWAAWSGAARRLEAGPGGIKILGRRRLATRAPTTTTMAPPPHYTGPCRPGQCRRRANFPLGWNLAVET